MKKLTLLIASLTLSILYLRTKRRVHNTPLPPGPPPDPLIGHSRIIPTKDHPEIFYEWSKTYGRATSDVPETLS